MNAFALNITRFTWQGLASLIVAAAFIPGLANAQEVGPGATSPDPATVPGIFCTVCLNHMPDFAGSERVMLDSGLFLRNERTGTVYHQTLNLSGKIQENGGYLQCSVVFYNEQNIASVQTMLETARDDFRAEFQQAYPNADIESLTASGDSTGFHRLAVFFALPN